MTHNSVTLEDMFTLFSKFGDAKSDGKNITLTNCDKWMKQANVIDKKLTTTDTGIAFNKFKAKTINFKDFEKYLADLAKSKSIDVNLIRDKLTNCGAPGTTNTTQAATSDVLGRLTDTTKYTGAHKERFDESGKGKGIEGRENVTDNSGYVTGYKEKDTYDKKH